MDLQIAVRTLREAVGLSQQAFAERSGLSIRAIANYEKDRPPTAKALFQFAKIASEAGRADLASIFSAAFQNEVGAASIDVTDELQKSALTALHQNNGPDWLDRQLVEILKKARKGHPLAYPVVLGGDRIPDQEARITYLENLLVELRLRKAVSARTLLEEMATERANQTGETKEKASLEILMQNPDLYARYSQERSAEGRELDSSASGASGGVPGTRQRSKLTGGQKK